ncbi:MAG: AAA family ATPase [Clostridia bacterium]|nr:AAA family ATPase [Clostridia bacterium]
MKKIIVIGCPGSGKSTFSKKLHKITGIPLFHLDMLYWNEDKTVVEKEIFLERLSEILQKDAYIIDGNYASTMEMRMSRCDTVFFLDYPTDICLDGIRERCGKERSDMPWVENSEDEEFVEFIKNYAQQNRPKVIELLKKYSYKNIFIFSNRSEADEFLMSI